MLETYPTPYSLYTQVSTDTILLCHLLYPITHTIQSGQDPTTRLDTIQDIILYHDNDLYSIALRQRDLWLINYRRNRLYTYETRLSQVIDWILGRSIL
jgi:hypothetical protein